MEQSWHSQYADWVGESHGLCWVCEPTAFEVMEMDGYVYRPIALERFTIRQEERLSAAANAGAQLARAARK
jgi:hypothetical protein